MSNPANFVQCSLSCPCLVINAAVLKGFSETLLCQLPCTSTSSPSPPALSALYVRDPSHEEWHQVTITAQVLAALSCSYLALCAEPEDLQQERWPCSWGCCHHGARCLLPGCRGAMGKAWSSPAQQGTARLHAPWRSTAHVGAGERVWKLEEPCVRGDAPVWRVGGVTWDSVFPPPAAYSPARATCPLVWQATVSSVTSVLLIQGFAVSPVPDSTNTRALNHTFWCFCIFHIACFFPPLLLPPWKGIFSSVSF